MLHEMKIKLLSRKETNLERIAKVKQTIHRFFTETRSTNTGECLKHKCLDLPVLSPPEFVYFVKASKVEQLSFVMTNPAIHRLSA